MSLSAQTELDSMKVYYNAIWYPNQSKIPITTATSFYEEKTHSFLVKGDTIRAIEAMETIIQAYSLSGEHYFAEKKIADTQKLIDKLDHKNFSLNTTLKLQNTQRNLYHRLGILYRKINDSYSAIKYYKKALEMSPSLQDSMSLMNNLAMIYKDEKEYQKADSILKIIYNKVQPMANYDWKWTVLDNLAHVESKLDLPGALEKMELALKENLIKNDPRKVFSSYRHLAIHHLDRRKDSLALKYISKAEEIAVSLNPYFLKEVLSLKMRLHSDSDVRKHQRLSDSLEKAQRDSEHKYAAKKYDSEKYEKETAQAQLSLSREKYNKNLLIIGSLVVTLISIFLFFYYKQRQKIVRTEERHITEKKLSKKVHDEVGNDVFYLMTQIQSHPDKFLKQNASKVLNNLNDIYSKARDISKDYTSVNTGSEFNDELLSLLNSYGTEQTKIITNKMDSEFWETVSAHKKEELYRILQELLTNMKKHSKASFVAITFIKKKQKMIVKYADNGVGVSDNNFHFSNGLRNVETRIEAIKGTIKFDSKPKKGFKAEIKFMA